MSTAKNIATANCDCGANAINTPFHYNWCSSKSTTTKFQEFLDKATRPNNSILVYVTDDKSKLGTTNIKTNPSNTYPMVLSGEAAESFLKAIIPVEIWIEMSVSKFQEVKDLATRFMDGSGVIHVVNA